MRERVVVLIAVALGLGLLTGCSTPATETPSAASPSAAGTSDGGGRATEIPTDLRECEVTDKDAVTTVASVRDVSYPVPDGFSEVAGYGQIVDAEGAHVDRYLGPDGADGAEVLAVVFYPALENGRVTDPCGQLDVDLVMARLAEHNADSGSEVVAAPELVEIAGAPAFVEDRRYPAYDMSVRHYWLYSRDDLLNIQCQWTSHEAEILAGCDALVAGLEIL